MAVLQGNQVEVYKDEINDLIEEYTKVLNKKASKESRKTSFIANIDSQIATLQDELDSLFEQIQEGINDATSDWGSSGLGGYTYTELTDATAPERPL